MPMTLQDLAARIGATVRGDSTKMINACAGLEDAGGNDVSFVANQQYVRHLKSTGAGAVIVAQTHAAASSRTLDLLISDDPYFAFREAVIALHGFRAQPDPGISKHAVIAPTAAIGADCHASPFTVIANAASIGERSVIYPHCFIGPNVTIGDDCIIYPNVTVYDGCVIGDRVILHAGCVIGQDGFGHATHTDDVGRVAHHKIPQVGNVVIEDDVELGANCTIDRATVGSTVIGKGTKFSDLIAIGHGTKIGNHNLVVAQTGIAGSAATGDYVVLGGQVGVSGHLRIGDRVQVAGKSGVMTDLDAGEQYGGIPAVPLSQAKRTALAAARLPELLLQLRELEKRVAELENRSE
jgi:UDP-3-O-[3-hydroxymyristoyl] glucosamine N-acyltransferase